MTFMALSQEKKMDISENTARRSQSDNIALGTASTETRGIPVGTTEPLGRDDVLGIASEETRGIPGKLDEPLGHWAIGIASEETQGFPVGADEPLGMNFQTGISAE